MERPNFMIYVKMHLHLPFGKALYLVGSCKALGSWDVREGLRLEWNEVPFLTNQGRHLARLKHNLLQRRRRIQIRYRRSPRSLQPRMVVRLQPAYLPRRGRKRLSLSEYIPSPIPDEKWNNEKITLQLITDNA
jgi:hypothetical protein